MDMYHSIRVSKLFDNPYVLTSQLEQSKKVTSHQPHKPGREHLAQLAASR